MKLNDMTESKFLKQSDIKSDTLVTFQSLKRVNVARDDEDPDYRWTAKFVEFAKPMVLNQTNLKRMFKALDEDTDNWIGKSAVLYVDPDVEFGGNIVGGLRLRGKRNPAAAAQQAARRPEGTDESDIPF